MNTFHNTTHPPLFISHGSPMMAAKPSVTSAFLNQLGATLPKPSACIVISAHFMASNPIITGAAQPETVHDFYGFPDNLYEITYPVQGHPELAKTVAKKLTEANFKVEIDSQLGIDHGVWIPLRHIYPNADIPTVALSVNPAQSALWHYQLGQALTPLTKKGVLIIGSGGFSHNLGELNWHNADAATPIWMQSFTDTLRQALLEGDIEKALGWRALPHALRNHPTPEHLYPLYVALGAAGKNPTAHWLHRAVEMGALALDAVAFQPTDLITL